MSGRLVKLTADVVASYVSKNQILLSDLPTLISTVHTSLTKADSGIEQEPEVSEVQKPAVPIKKSVQPDFIICLEDGKKLKMLKRHLHTSYGMTPDDYRKKWNLPSDYPMVAPNYSAVRAKFAHDIGLGKRVKG